MSSHYLRSLQDINLAKKLTADPVVQSTNAALHRQANGGSPGARRRLLSTSVRLSESMSPVLYRLAKHCAKKLDIKIPIELYTYSSPQHNAACVKPEDGQLFITFSSSLLNDYNEEELCFVMGHELGHYLFNHHDIPVGHILRDKEKPDPSLALMLTCWSRYAEISADRAGAHCAKNFDGVARALFKLSSGVTNDVIQFNLDTFVQQVEEMQVEDEDYSQREFSQDWFLTHPFNPLRVKALQLFYQSELHHQSGESVANLELGVQDLMSFMEPEYLQGKTNAAKHMKSLLFAGCILVADASDGINQAEINAFEDFFGEDSYRDNFNVAQLNEDLVKRCKQVRSDCSMPRRMQVIRDICNIAIADNSVPPEERLVIERIGKYLEVPISFIDSMLNSDYQLGFSPKSETA